MSFLHEETAQDITEYSLMLAFVVMASAALFFTSTDAMSGIWAVSNTQITAASHLAGS